MLTFLKARSLSRSLRSHLRADHDHVIDQDLIREAQDRYYMAQSTHQRMF